MGDLERFVLTALAAILGATVLTNPWSLDRIQQATLFVAIVAMSVFAARTVERIRADAVEAAASSGMTAGPPAAPDQGLSKGTSVVADNEAPVTKASNGSRRSIDPADSGSSNDVKPPTQVMVNSPGGVQAGRDVIISGDVQLIRSIELHVAIETTTVSTAIGPERFDWGLGSVVALFTSDKRRLRFVSDLRVYDQQIAETRRRLRIVYSPETPPEILGQPIAVLGSVEVLAANFVEILKKQNFDTRLGGTLIECGVMLNGIPIGRVKVELPSEQLNREQANLAVASVFSQIPQAYRSATERR